ncbi:MAG: ATPase, T2SS/T4P/T4SS family [Candidatus Omnitrophica bacterium]|nr:ATPase, T2SS/T4P/T4SS family [Candidatus Omnitrophota bacterium]
MIPPAGRKKLGEILLEDGLLTQAQLTDALNNQAKQKERKYLGELLVDLGYITEEGLALTLSKKLGLKYVSFSDNTLVVNIAQDLDRVIDQKYAGANFIVPVAKAPIGLTVVMWDPLNFNVVDYVKRVAHMNVIIQCSTKKDILQAIERLYVDKGVSVVGPDPAAMIRDPQRTAAMPRHTEIDDLKTKAAEAPVIKLVNSIIQRAIREKASDIHIDPQVDKVSIRFRLDGILYEAESLPKETVAAIISRIKILSRLDIAEKRLPQDGGFMMRLEDRNIDFRISTMPTIYGEKVVMRVLDKAQMKAELGTLGLTPADLERVNQSIYKPYGLIFLTGPTGSGKTTTLYCILNAIRSPKKNILTIEDPVEYRIEGVNQVQANPQIGLDFARGLRTFLRQDPDIIMVGEVRDLETAEICVRSALVGRLVLSTLHTNDTVGAVARLVDFGIEPFLLAATLNMIIAQRLARRLCEKCKEPAKVDAKVLHDFKLEGVSIFGPKGCPACNNRGFSGRLPVFEIMSVDNEIRDMIEKKADATTIKDSLIKKGMMTLRQDGLTKVRDGLTSLDEILAITMESGV